MNPRPSLVPALLAVLAMTAPSLSLGAAEQGRRPTLRAWDARLEEVRRHLDAGEWTEARAAAGALVDEMVVRLGGGADDPKLLAAVVTFRAIAEAQLGADDAAAWSWIVVQNLDPAMRTAPVEGLGRAAEVFARHRLRALGQPPPGIAALEAIDFSSPPISPVPVAIPRAEPPAGAPAQLWRRNPLRVEIAVDRAGRVVEPVVVKPETEVFPGKIVLGLEALRRWRFVPAPEAGPAAAPAFWVDPFRPPDSFLYDLAGEPKLQPIHELALAGSWTEADARVRAALAAAPAECLAAGDAAATRGGDCDLGRLNLLRALTASGLGESEDAAWHRSVALAFSPPLADVPLEVYGEPGRALADLSAACPSGDWEACPATPLWRIETGIEPPRKRAGEPPRLPRALAGHRGDRVVVRAVIGADGRPRDPAVLAGGHPLAGLLALDAFSAWRFEPARRGGEPVAVVVELTVPFAPEAPADRVDAWRRRLDELDRTLLAAGWEAAAPLAEALIDEIAAEGGGAGSDLVAEAVTALALADAGRGRTDDAVWNWHLAQNLAHELRWADLSAYGAAGELLAAHPLRRPGELAAGAPAPAGDEPEFGSLRRTSGKDPVYPEPHGRTVPVVEIVLRAGGPESPVVLSVDPPAAVLAALRALRGWRFAPDSEQPSVRRLSLPPRIRPGAPAPEPATSRFAKLALEALNDGDGVLAECYWDQVGAADRGRFGRNFEPLRNEPSRIDARWSLARPPRGVPASNGPGHDPTTVDGDVRAPVKVHTPPPQYTEAARKARVQGVVILQAIVDREGNVRNVEALRGLPEGLDDQAIEAVCRWKFRPATLDGKPVDVYYNLTVNFTLMSSPRFP